MSKKKQPSHVVDTSDFDSSSYKETLDEESRAWAEQFDREWLKNGTYDVPAKERILKTKEQRKEANRNYNRVKRDALYVASRMPGQLLELDEEARVFMEDAADEFDWRNTYKIQGFKPASELIYDQAIRELDIKKIDDWKTVLIRMYIKLEKLRKLNDKEKRDIPAKDRK